MSISKTTMKLVLLLLVTNGAVKGGTEGQAMTE